VKNNPLNHTDPTGKCTDGIDLWCIFAGVFEGAMIGSELGPLGAIGGAILGGGLALGTGLLTQEEEITSTPTQNLSEVVGNLATTFSSEVALDAYDDIGYDSEACSFSADTQVTTSTGEEPISEIEENDPVLAYDEGLDSNGHYRVQATFSHVDPEILLLQIEGEEIETTPEHPFYTKEQGWVAAGELWAGAQVKKADGSWGQVESKKIALGPKVMYNLTVARAHTFFVGQQRWLVHNGCMPYGGKGSPKTVYPNDPNVIAKYPEGVNFNKEGYPDFSPYATDSVKIDMQGDRSDAINGDFGKANAAAGYDSTPDGYTWHHHQDRETMQLVPTDLHKNIPHSGGVSEIKKHGPLRD
jgi:hypothetical protein